MIGLLFYLNESDDFLFHNIQLIIFYLHKLIFFQLLIFLPRFKINFENYRNFDESFSLLNIFLFFISYSENNVNLMKNVYQIDQNGQNEPKLTKVAGTQLAKMDQNEHS